MAAAYASSGKAELREPSSPAEGTLGTQQVEEGGTGYAAASCLEGACQGCGRMDCSGRHSGRGKGWMDQDAPDPKESDQVVEEQER